MSPRPNAVVGCNVQTDHVNQWYNPACFSLEAPGTLGNLARNSVTGPGFFDMDVALLKDTRFKENLDLQFRAEFFNILNKTNYGLPVPAGSQGGGNLFGTGTGPGPAPGLVYLGNAGQITSQNGTPRQVQFALKLIF